MKRALIDSNNSRVLQVVNLGEEFEVHANLYWVDCPDDADTYYLYDPEELTFEDPHGSSKDEFGNPVEPFNMQRQRAYPPSGDQLDMLWREIRDNGSISTDGDWFRSIAAVKAAIPRPTNYDPADPVATTRTQWVAANGEIIQLFTDVSGTGGSGSSAEFKVRKATDLYQVVVTEGGTNYAVSDVITITGDDYNCQVSVTEVAPGGTIVSVSVI